jgi:hypothetical protein
MMKEFKGVGDAVKYYVQQRDRLRTWKKKMEEEEQLRKQSLTEIEVWLLMKADEMGVDSFKTPAGTAYKQKTEHYRIGNWAAFVEYVKETNNFQLFEKRVAKLAAKEIHSTDGLPGGLDYSSEFVMHVLRPTKKGEK